MRKNNCARRYKVWLDEEFEALEREFESGYKIGEVMRLHQRNLRGIAAALVRIGKIKKRSECYEVLAKEEEETGL